MNNKIESELDDIKLEVDEATRNEAGKGDNDEVIKLFCYEE